MPYTVRSIANSLLLFIRKEERGVPVPSGFDDPLPAILNAINGALMECATIGPLNLFRDRRSATIYPPVVLSVPTVASNSRNFTLTALQGWMDWMIGCSVQFNGSEPWNEIVDYNEDTSIVTLLHEVITGGTGVSAQVFCDSLTLDADVLQVTYPVTIADKYSLSPVHTLQALFAASYTYWRAEDYGFYGALSTSTRRTTYRPAPLVYFVDTRWQEGYARARLSMRLAPMPLDNVILHYRARVEPPQFAMTDIYATGNPSADPGTVIGLDDAFVINVFLPIATQRFTGTPYFRNDNALPEISRQYQLAIKTAEQMRPQGQPGFRIRPTI